MLRTPSRLLVIMATLATFGTASEAVAGQGFSFTFTPKGEEAQALRQGLKTMSLIQSLKNAARVEQRGSNNAAAILQTRGTGNAAAIIQAGRGNSASITQNGSNNSYGILQLGRNRSSNVVQNGNGGTGFTIQFGN